MAPPSNENDCRFYVFVSPGPFQAKCTHTWYNFDTTRNNLEAAQLTPCNPYNYCRIHRNVDSFFFCRVPENRHTFIFIFLWPFAEHRFRFSDTPVFVRFWVDLSNNSRDLTWFLLICITKVMVSYWKILGISWSGGNPHKTCRIWYALTIRHET